MQAAARTKQNFNAGDHNPAEFDFLEADRGGVAGSFSFAERKDKSPSWASTLSQHAPRVVTGVSHFPVPPKAKQDFLARRVHSKKESQQKLRKQFGWAPNVDKQGMVYAVGAWLLFLALWSVSA